MFSRFQPAMPVHSSPSVLPLTVLRILTPGVRRMVAGWVGVFCMKLTAWQLL
jgi:hypothetical protein